LVKDAPTNLLANPSRRRDQEPEMQDPLCNFRINGTSQSKMLASTGTALEVYQLRGMSLISQIKCKVNGLEEFYFTITNLDLYTHYLKIFREKIINVNKSFKIFVIIYSLPF